MAEPNIPLVGAFCEIEIGPGGFVGELALSFHTHSANSCLTWAMNFATLPLEFLASSASTGRKPR